VSGLEWPVVLAAVIAGWVALEWAVRPRRRYHFLDGVRAVSMRRARFRAWKARQRSPKSVQFGLWLPVECLVGSFLILAASRAGKTVLLNLFRKSLLPLFADPAESVLVIDFDPKRDNQFWAEFLPPAVPFVELSPSVEGCGFDLFGDAEHDGDLVTVAGRPCCPRCGTTTSRTSATRPRCCSPASCGPPAGTGTGSHCGR
jgi:hypothetical protein